EMKAGVDFADPWQISDRLLTRRERTAGTPAVLAVGTKYAGLLFVPTIALVSVFAGRYGGRERSTGEARRRGWPAAIGRGLLYVLAFAAPLYGWLRLLGPTYLAGITT